MPRGWDDGRRPARNPDGLCRRLGLPRHFRLITFDVLGRRFFGISTQATTELSGYALAFGMAWGLAHTLSMRAHVRIDVVVNLFPRASASGCTS